MNTVYLEWTPSPCGGTPSYYSLYWRRESVGVDGNSLTNYSAEEIVSGGVLLDTLITKNFYIHLTNGSGNSYAIVSHKDEKTSRPVILASNVEVLTEAVEDGGSYFFVNLIRDAYGNLIQGTEPIEFGI